MAGPHSIAGQRNRANIPAALAESEGTRMDNRTSSCLFTLRLWHEQLGEGQVEWRGKVQYTDNGETLYFRQWGMLLEFLQGTLEQLASRHVSAEDGKGLTRMACVEWRVR